MILRLDYKNIKILKKGATVKVAPFTPVTGTVLGRIVCFISFSGLIGTIKEAAQHQLLTLY